MFSATLAWLGYEGRGVRYELKVTNPSFLHLEFVLHGKELFLTLLQFFFSLFLLIFNLIL